MNMHIWVFSYNRGIFLQNCVESIERCAPMCELTVFDDNSTDAETQAILAAIAKKHRVLTPEPGAGESKHGGLYANMQSAFEAMPAGELMCCLQDDTQMVREIDEQDLAAIVEYYTSCEDAGFVQPAFIRGSNRAVDAAYTRYDSDCGMYFIDRRNRSAGTFYSDIFVADVDRLRSREWRFQPREGGNEQQAKQHYRPMGYMRNPFVAWLPNVPAFRGKVRTWAMRRAEKISNSGFYPVAYMSSEEAQEFSGRENRALPYAEDFLGLREGQLPEPWRYYPLQDKKWLKKLSSLEVSLNKIMRRR